MSSKKHRPIVMNRNKRPGRTFTILKKAVAITAVLAFVEVIVLVVIHYRKADKPTASKPVSSQPVVKSNVKDSSQAMAIAKPKMLTANDPADVVDKKATVDTVKSVKPAEKVPQPVIQKAVKDTSLPVPAKPKEVKVAKKLTSQQMFDILNELRMEKMNAGNPAKCVSIRIVNSSNAEYGSTIANYLRNNGYIISGREVIQGSQKGIHVDASGPCIKLTVGNL